MQALDRIAQVLAAGKLSGERTKRDRRVEYNVDKARDKRMSYEQDEFQRNERLNGMP